jgi:hypothetical protein
LLQAQSDLAKIFAKSPFENAGRFRNFCLAPILFHCRNTVKNTVVSPRWHRKATPENWAIVQFVVAALDQPEATATTVPQSPKMGQKGTDWIFLYLFGKNRAS